MQVGRVQVWLTAKQAAEMGFTHRARMWGIIPGFYSDGGADGPMWASRSDLLNPIEDALNWIGMAVLQSQDEEPAFMFKGIMHFT